MRQGKVSTAVPVILLVLATLLPVPRALATEPAFAAAQNIAAGFRPGGIVVGDFNGDGRPDLFIINFTTVSVVLGNGGGTFASQVIYPISANASLGVAADFNGDGKLDVIIGNFAGSNLYLIPGNGDGSFGSASSIASGLHPLGIVAVDLDNDGKPDLVVVNNGDSSVSVFKGNGDGSFVPGATYLVGADARVVTAGDFNNDGRTDIAVTSFINNSVSVLLGNGDGSFKAGVAYAAGTGPHAVTSGDFNGDGKLDLVVTNNGGGNISVLLGNGDGSFAPAVNYAVGAQPRFVVAADLNGDGKLDLAVTSNANSTVSVLAGNGDGTFAVAVNFATGTTPNDIQAADFNGDGNPDLAVANFASLSASVLLNQLPPSPAAGVWWNPAEGGRGFTIEKSGNNLFMAAYLYDASGRSTWYGAGPAPMTGASFSAPMTTYSGGQTLTGAYKPPAQGASPGNIAVTFSDAAHGTLTWPGGTIPIQRYEFATRGLNSPPAATQPHTGWWWNPGEGGRGFSVEIQNNTAFIATYMYDSAGNSVWFASGPAALTGSSYLGSWSSYTGGQTLTGAYRAPAGATSAGNLTVQFMSPTAGTLTLPDGRPIPIQRFGFRDAVAAPVTQAGQPRVDQRAI